MKVSITIPSRVLETPLLIYQHTWSRIFQILEVSLEDIPFLKISWEISFAINAFDDKISYRGFERNADIKNVNRTKDKTTL